MITTNDSGALEPDRATQGATTDGGSRALESRFASENRMGDMRAGTSRMGDTMTDTRTADRPATTGRTDDARFTMPDAAQSNTDSSPNRASPDSGSTERDADGAQASMSAGASAQTAASEPRPTTPFVTDMAEVLKMPFAEARALALREFDRFFLSAALERNSGNIARTARALGLHRQSLQKLMTRRGLKSRRPTTNETTES